MSQDDIELLRQGYVAFNRGEPMDVFANLTDDFEARDRAELPDPRVHHGEAGAQDALRFARDGFDDYEVEPYEMVQVGDCVVVAARQHGRGSVSGVLVEGEIFHVWRFRDGRLAGLRAFSTREDAMADARSG